MRIAVWNLPPADLFVSGLQSGHDQTRFDLLRTESATCESLLRRGDVDVALLPTLSILRNPKDFSVLPAVALSSWRFPFARILVTHGLDQPVAAVAYDPRYMQEHAMATIVLREHYKMAPEFVPFNDASHDHPVATNTDARLVVGPNVPGVSHDELSLDLGQEWYELAQYPMVWGLFATMRDSVDAEMIRSVREGIRLSERQRSVWVRAQETSADLHTFYTDDLRFRLDDLAVAGLTELVRLLFFYRILDEVPDVPFAHLSEDENDDEDQPLV